MRIAFVTLGFAPLRTSGLDISGERLVGTLVAAGHEVTVVAGATGPLVEGSRPPGLTVQRVRLGRSHWIGYAPRAAEAVRRLNLQQKFDVVHFWDVYLAHAYRGPYLATLHHSFRQRWATWDRRHSSPLSQAYRYAYYGLARQLAEKPALRRAAGLLAISTTTRDEFVQHYRVEPGRVAVARHGIDTAVFRPMPATDLLRSRLGIGAQEPVLLFTGFVTPRKGLEHLAKALPMIEPAPRLIIAGRWRASDREQFRRLAGAAAGQIIEAGFIPDELMPAYHSLADVYVSASLLEGFGLPLAEALACETPVVTVNGGAVAEVVGPGGILVPPADPTSLADAVTALLTDPVRRQALGCSGRQHIVQEFSLERMYGDTLAAYRRFAIPE